MTIQIQQLMAEVERVKDAFDRAVFAAQDVDAALACAAEDCELTNLPAGTGSAAAGSLRGYLAEHVAGHVPPDLRIRRTFRTADRWRLADEFTVSFTHDRPMPWLLPGVAATGRRAEITAVALVAVRRARITSYRTLWDVHSLMQQLDLTRR